MEPFGRVTIIGVGLIGGSLGMELRARGLAREVVGVTRVEETIAAARARGAIDMGTVDPVAGVAGADLVVLATPPGLVVSMAQRVLPHLRPGTLLTDVASVKANIVRPIEAIVRQDGVVFVGGHPMAGNEGQGIAAAEPGLFEGTVYLLTPTDRTAPSGVKRLADLARSVGAVPVELSPDEHDRTVALTSHLPYLVAAALMRATATAGPTAGPAFLGATRVAGSPVAMWGEICRLNQESIQKALQAFREELARLEEAMTDGDRLGEMLEAARQARLRLGTHRSAGGSSGDRDRN